MSAIQVDFGVNPDEIVAVFFIKGNGEVLEEELKGGRETGERERDESLLAAYRTCLFLRQMRVSQSITTGGLLPTLATQDIQAAVAVLAAGRLVYRAAADQPLPDTIFPLEEKLEALLST